MIPKYFNLDDSASEKKLNLFVDELLGVEKFSPDPQRLEHHFQNFKDFFKERNIPIVIVAGTNGKGEVSLLLERYCLDNGLDPFVWNSPHILSVRERMSYGGRPVETPALLKAFSENRELSRSLSYYEFLFYIFCHLSLERIKAQDKKNSVLILEVGLGGRLDATNFFDADLAVLTSISRDHVEFLGHKLSGILKEKIAVSRSERYLVAAVEQSYLRPLIHEHCSANRIELVDLWEADLKEGMDFHQRNQICAEMSFHKLYKNVLRHNDAAKINPVEHVWGRPLKMTYRGCQFILLGSHNLDGLRHMAKWTSLENQKLVDGPCSSQAGFYFDEAWLSFSRQDHEDLKQCLGLINESPCIAKKVYLTSFNHPRATKWAALTDCAKSVMENKIGKKVYLEQYFETIISQLFSEQQMFESQAPRRILVAGSYYFLGSFVLSLSPGDYQFS